MRDSGAGIRGGNRYPDGRWKEKRTWLSEGAGADFALPSRRSRRCGAQKRRSPEGRDIGALFPSRSLQSQSDPGPGECPTVDQVIRALTVVGLACVGRKSLHGIGPAGVC